MINHECSEVHVVSEVWFVSAWGRIDLPPLPFYTFDTLDIQYCNPWGALVGKG